MIVYHKSLGVKVAFCVCVGLFTLLFKPRAWLSHCLNWFQS